MTFHNVIILIKSIVNKNENKYYYNMFLEKSLYKYKFQEVKFVYYKYYIMIELKFMKELMSIKQLHRKSLMFVTVSVS